MYKNHQKKKEKRKMMHHIFNDVLHNLLRNDKENKKEEYIHSSSLFQLFLSSKEKIIVIGKPTVISNLILANIDD